MAQDGLIETATGYRRTPTDSGMAAMCGTRRPRNSRPDRIVRSDGSDEAKASRP